MNLESEKKTKDKFVFNFLTSSKICLILLNLAMATRNLVPITIHSSVERYSVDAFIQKATIESRLFLLSLESIRILKRTSESAFINNLNYLLFILLPSQISYCYSLWSSLEPLSLASYFLVRQFEMRFIVTESIEVQNIKYPLSSFHFLPLSIGKRYAQSPSRPE